MRSELVTADSLCREFGKTEVLRNVTFSLAEGSVEPDLIHSLMGEPEEVRGPEPLDLETAESRRLQGGA